MTKKIIRRLDKLFSIYAANLKIFKPELDDKFLCPICQETLDRSALNGEHPLISIAHIIPESAGGHQYTITCTKCNNNIGSKFDNHLKLEIEYYEWLNGKREDYGHITYGKNRLPVICKLGYDSERSMPSFSIRPVSKFEPKYPAFIESARSDWSNFTINYGSNSYFIPLKRNISLIHSSFLLMFYQFGYEYILSPNAQVIRDLILENSESNLINRLVYTYKGVSLEHSLPQTGIFFYNDEFFSFFVALPFAGIQNSVRIVLLPGFGKDGIDSFNRLLNSDMSIDILKIRLVRFEFYEKNGRLDNTNLKGSLEYMWDLYTKPEDKEKIIHRHYPKFFVEFKNKDK